MMMTAAADTIASLLLLGASLCLVGWGTEAAVPPHLTSQSCVARAQQVLQTAPGTSTWPCCRCAEAQVFLSVVNSGKDGVYTTVLDRDQLPEDLWEQPMRVSAGQNVILSGDTAANQAWWGAVPQSFAVGVPSGPLPSKAGRDGAELTMRNMRVRGGVELGKDGTMLVMTDIALDASLTLNSATGTAVLEHVKLSGKSGFNALSGTILIAFSDLRFANNPRFGQPPSLARVALTNSSIGSWADWMNVGLAQAGQLPSYAPEGVVFMPGVFAFDSTNVTRSNGACVCQDFE